MSEQGELKTMALNREWRVLGALFWCAVFGAFPKLRIEFFERDVHIIKYIIRQGILFMKIGIDANNWTTLIRRSETRAFAIGFASFVFGFVPGLMAQSSVSQVSSAEDGADLYGFTSQFQEKLSALGEISVDEFLERYDRPEQFVDSLSYDPASEAFLNSFMEPAGRPRSDPFFGPIAPVKEGLELNEEELEVLGKHGFVVSGRHGNHSYTESYYQIFIRDRPVFISLDSILHAWNQGYRSILEETEALFLAPLIEKMLEGMREQLSSIADRVNPDLEASLHDADLYLTVAASLASGTTLPSSIGQRDAQVESMMAMISSLDLHEFPLFGRTNREIIDFSQFKPRGHYTKSPQLEKYFRSMMWLGRVDFRVAGPPKLASPRELGTALILREALTLSGQLESWTAADRILQTFVGLPDSMTVPQLSALLESSELDLGEVFPSLEELALLQAQIEASSLGVQAIISHGFYASPGNESFKLPRSFALFGQRFVMDSWALSNLVFKSISWNGQAVRRRLPSGLDVAFSVFGNAAAAPILADRIRNVDGVPFRDGYPIQHHLGTLHDVFNEGGIQGWGDNIYTSWIHTLKQWGQAHDDSIPEVFRTREWGKKTMSSQLASWTYLRHNTVLYAKQSVTQPVLCSFPHSYLEPDLGAWESLTAMVRRAASDLARLTPDTGITGRHVRFLNSFADTCETLTEIVRKQNNREVLTASEDRFLKNMVEIMVDYVGQRTYSGWYPKLYYTAPDPFDPSFGFSGVTAQHPSDIWDPVVTDVHTDFPSIPDGDPGTILHQGVGNTAMLFVSVQCAENRMYAGPVSTYYEFTSGAGKFDRMTDEEWKEKLKNNEQAEEPEWSQGHRLRGSVSIASSGPGASGGVGLEFPPIDFPPIELPPPPMLDLPKTIDFQVLDNGRLEMRWPFGTTLWRSRELGGERRFKVDGTGSNGGRHIRRVATSAPHYFFWLE